MPRKCGTNGCERDAVALILYFGSDPARCRPCLEDDLDRREGYT